MGTTLQYGNFTVTKSQPATDFGGDTVSNIVRFTITDSANLLTTSKMIRAVLCDAIETWLAAERSDLDTNGDTDVKGRDEYVPVSSSLHSDRAGGGGGAGDGYSKFRFKFEDKAAEVTLTSLTSISSTGTITATRPYADVI